MEPINNEPAEQMSSPLQNQSTKPQLLATNLPRMKVLLILAGLLIVLGVGWFIFYRLHTLSVKRQPLVSPPASEVISQPQEVNFDKNDAELAFLQEGKIWSISKDLKKRMAYELTGAEGQITDFKFSHSGQLYWLTNTGELWRMNTDKAEPLVSKTQDMSNGTQASDDPAKPLSYVKGKVTNFYISPDGNYLAYETLEKYTGCCGSTSDIPVTQLRMMRSDGTNKVVVTKPSSVNRELVFFDGWLPDSKNFLFHFSAPDEPTHGSPFFEVGLNGTNPKKFTAIEYPEAGGTITVAGAAPIFSSDSKRLAYVEDGVNGEGKIWIANADGTQKKLLFDDKSLNLVNLSWSEDGNLLTINSSNKVAAVNTEGKVVFQKEVKQPEELENTISPDNKYVVGLDKTQDGKVNKLFILNLDAGEKKEFSMFNSDNQQSALYVYPQFFSEDGRLYYLAGSNQWDYSNKNNSTFQLWVVDTTNWKNYKIADNVLQVRMAPSPVNSWKTYSSEQFGYLIKLPQDFRFEKTDGNVDVEMVTITSPDKSFSVNLQAGRSYTVMEDWVKGVFGTTYVNQIKVNGDESSLLRINDNNYPMNNTYTVGFYAYRNPIFYQLYSQQLKSEYVELFKTIASTFKTQQVANKFEISTSNQPRSNTLFNLTNTLTSKANWNKFTDSFYQMTVSYPRIWSAKNLPKNYDNPSTFEVSTNTVYASAPTERKKVWLRVGDFQQFSTAGGVCYNQICEEVGKVTVTIKGKQYSASIIRASSNSYGDQKQNVFGYYAFQFELTDKGYSMSGFSQPYTPAVTAYFYTPEEGQTIVDIISTISY